MNKKRKSVILLKISKVPVFYWNISVAQPIPLFHVVKLLASCSIHSLDPRKISHFNFPKISGHALYVASWMLSSFRNPFLTVCFLTYLLTWISITTVCFPNAKSKLSFDHNSIISSSFSSNRKYQFISLK